MEKYIAEKKNYFALMIYVKVGEKITQGMKVAEIGATGRVTGPHLDWRFNWQGERLDPALLMQDTLANKK